MSEPAKSYRFGHAQRLHGGPAFDAVFDARVKKNIGPLTLFAKPNNLPHARLGLSVSRRVGKAVARNRIKRLIREAFRLSQHDWPGGYDVVMVVRPHEPQALADYQRMLAEGVRGVHQEWERRKKKS